MTERYFRKRLRVLILHGENIDRSLVQVAELNGNRVDLVSTTEDALAVLAIIPYDLVVVNNADAAAAISGVRSQTEILHQPVLLYIGTGDGCCDPFESLKAGADACTRDIHSLQVFMECAQSTGGMQSADA